MCSAARAGPASVSGSPCFTVLIVILTITGIIGSVQVSTPPVVEAEIGKPISIPCVPEISTPSTVKYVQWFVMEKDIRQRIYFQDGENRIINNKTRYTDRINVDKSYTLTIDNVELRDERTFCCQVGAGPAGNGEATTELKVFDAPEIPEIFPSNKLISIMKTEPSEIATCVTRNGYPAPNITWYKDHTPLQATTKINNKMYMIPQATKEPSGLYTIASTLYYLPEKKDKDSKFYCEVNYRMPTGVEKMKKSIKIDIQISYPTENVEFLYQPKILKETDNMILECKSDGSSSVENTFYRVRDGQEEETLQSGTGNTFEIVGVKRNDSGVYGCRVLDFDADDKDFNVNKTITINYLDPIVLKPRGPYIFEEGEKNKNIYCSAEGSQQTSVIWKKHKMVSSTNLLQLPVVTSDDSGNYTCEVTIRGVPSLFKKKSIRVTVKEPPKVNCTEKIFYKNRHYVNLTCIFKGYPTPNITCSIGKEVKDIRKHLLPNHIVISELIVLLPAEGLNVTCNGTNEYGSKTHNSVVQRESTAVSTKRPPIAGKTHRGSSGGMLIVIIIVCIILLAFLGAILYFLYKKGKIPCGRSGKQDITRTDVHDDVVVEVKNDQKVPEETVLLQGVNGEKKLPNDQGKPACLFKTSNTEKICPMQ
ncbi:cell surface glycoprotein MUC18-like isoform X2 [Chiloscyllium plagiosum]|uniref:cell surface glycoprotein MUC18-like isoform X2 n=1 Tax=Chiloscyllium plagiosum TaxID=36176 RepID=UPI001CB8257A|nr:cell surface glycoprotein MUC18-like isoform X2 [Chiloscyllium plagiosum]